jgi:hypothetical protein
MAEALLHYILIIVTFPQNKNVGVRQRSFFASSVIYFLNTVPCFYYLHGKYVAYFLKSMEVI